MAERVLLIDYENIHDAGLKKLPAHERMMLFVGNEQRKSSEPKPPAEFLQAALKAGKRIDLIPVSQTGSNNLDFHMAYYLGTAVAENPFAEYIAVSDDDDLDPLLAHLKSRGFNCRRAATRAKAAAPKAAAPKPVPVPPAAPKTAKPAKAAKPATPAKAPKTITTASALAFLHVSKHPPKTRDALLHHLGNHYGIGEAETAKLVDGMAKEGHFKIAANGKITY